MPTRLAVLFALLLIAGCSDPAVSRLEPGQRVILVNPNSKYLMLSDPSDRLGLIPQGSDAVVISDKATEDPAGPKYRKVRVVVKGGEKDGVEGTIYREYVKAN